MHPNDKLLREADEAQARADVDGFMAAHSDDVVIHVLGHSSFAGTHEGKERFGELFQRFMEATPEYTFESHAYLADDEHGVILQRSHYQRGDESVDSNDTFVCHFRDGKISEIWISSEDQDAVDRFLG